MRNTLDELPVLLLMMRGGILAGGLAFALSLPRKLYNIRRRGLRCGLWRGALFFCMDLLICLGCAILFAASLLRANGGEMRLYAVLGFLLPLALAVKLLNALAFGVPLPDDGA